MPTHRALFLPDIAYEIANAAAQEQGLLTRLARVNKTFRDPALRVLWARMDTLRPLFNLFSESTSVHVQQEVDPEQWGVRRSNAAEEHQLVSASLSICVHR